MKYFKLHIVMIFIVAFFCFSLVSINNVKADYEEDEKLDHTCIICNSDKHAFEMEKQFRDRIKIIKSILGDSVDEIALAATVLHKEDALEAVKSRYDENFDKNAYRENMTALFKGEGSGEKTFDTSSGMVGSSSGKAAEKVDLLNAAAIIMADSAGWTGKYNEESYKKALAGDKLVGNSTDNALINGVFCGVGAAADGLFSFNNVIFKFASGQDVMTEVDRTTTRWHNMTEICGNGYVGGVYNITPELQPNDQIRELQKQEIAQEIIDLIHYYKLLVDYKEDKDECVSGVSLSLNGNTQAADLLQYKTYEERLKIIGPIAQAVYAKTGAFASVLLAQTIKECNMGEAYRDSSFIKANNLLGVTCRTETCMNGFSVYKNLEEAFLDYAKMLDNGLYGNWRDAKTPEEVIKIIEPVYCPASDNCDEQAYINDVIGFIQQYNLKRFDQKAKVVTVDNSVANWKQYEGSWKDLNVGNGGTMSSIGCLVTASAIQIARSGTKITKLPNNYSKFDPGALVTALNNNHGFVYGGGLIWDKLSVIASNWRIGNSVSLGTGSNSVLAETISKELSSPISNGYQKFIVLEISHNGSSEHWVAVKGVENGKVIIYDPGAQGTTLDENYSGWYVKSYTVMFATDVQFGKIGTSTDTTGDVCEVDLNYDYEKMLKASRKVSMSGNPPGVDLANSKYGSVEAFNQHIKECVKQAGYGTRSGVVAAGVCLTYDYIEATGKHFRYILGSSIREGITSDYHLDCSGFVWWAVYNGGFKHPTEAFTGSQAKWAIKNNYRHYDYERALPGDILNYSPLNGSMGHSRLIIGKNEKGLYIAEENGGHGAEITFSSYKRLSSRHYWVIDMSDFYANPANRR